MVLVILFQVYKRKKAKHGSDWEAELADPKFLAQMKQYKSGEGLLHCTPPVAVLFVLFPSPPLLLLSSRVSHCCCLQQLKWIDDVVSVPVYHRVSVECVAWAR